jgi:hypothetical protein
LNIINSSFHRREHETAELTQRASAYFASLVLCGEKSADFANFHFPKKRTLATSAFEISLESGVHKQLGDFSGQWEGSTKTWFEPGVLADESPMKGTIRIILGGRFILYEYEGSLAGKPFEGINIFGFSMSHKKLQSAWIDSFHMGTAIMFSSGNETGNKLAVTGSYGEGADGGEAWGWRTELQLNGGNELVITSYNISPAGEEAKGTETIYHRATAK